MMRNPPAIASTVPAPVRTPAAQRPAGKYVPALDGIRGLAILAVLVTHSVPRLPNTGLGYWYNQAIEAGSFGVDGQGDDDARSVIVGNQTDSCRADRWGSSRFGW
jgi:hypothetical protein